MVQVSSLENTLVESVLKVLASALYFALYVTTGFNKRCSGLKRKLASAINKCKACLDPQVSDVDYKAVELDGNNYKVVNQFCYIGDMISVGGGAEASTIARVRSGLKSFRVLLPLLASLVISLETKGRLYAACVRSVVVYGSETWRFKVEDTARYPELIR